MLDVAVLDTIKKDVRKYLGQKIATQEQFDIIWNKCRTSIGSKCKYHRQMKLRAKMNQYFNM